jgi:hypothetical protein
LQDRPERFDPNRVQEQLPAKIVAVDQLLHAGVEKHDTAHPAHGSQEQLALLLIAYIQ